MARVKEVLESVGGSVWFTSGLTRDDHSDTAYRRRCSPKELLHNREADRWRTAVQTKPMLRSYLCVRAYDLRYQEYPEHPDWQVNLARWRLRTGICCLAEAKGRWSGIAVSGRTCECPGCDKAHEVYIVPRTGRLTTRERTILENTTVRWPAQTRHLVYASTTAT